MFANFIANKWGFDNGITRIFNANESIANLQSALMINDKQFDAQ